MLEAADDADAEAGGQGEETHEADERQRAAGLGKHRGRSGRGRRFLRRHRARLRRRLRSSAGNLHLLFGDDGLFLVDDVRGHAVAAGESLDGHGLAVAIELEALGNSGDLVDLTELVAVDDGLADALDDGALADLGGLDDIRSRGGGDGLGELGARLQLGDRNLLAVDIEEEVGRGLRRLGP